MSHGPVGIVALPPHSCVTGEGRLSLSGLSVCGGAGIGTGLLGGYR